MELSEIAETVTVLGHIRPDVDCATAMWIANRFLAGNWFPGRNVTFEFAKANKMPELAKDTEHFHIVVDGGEVYDPSARRFDTHGNKDYEHESATSLISRELPPVIRTHLADLVDGVRLHDIGEQPPEDNRAKALVGLYHLLAVSYGTDDRSLVKRWCRILDAWYYQTIEMQQIVLEAANHVEYHGRVAVLPPNAPRALTAKVFRDNPNVWYVVFNNDQNIGIMVDTKSKRKGDVRLPNGFAKSLLDELTIRKRTGEFSEWFFHPAGFYVGRGSPKSPVETPSSLTPDDLCRLLLDGTARMQSAAAA